MRPAAAAAPSECVEADEECFGRIFPNGRCFRHQPDDPGPGDWRRDPSIDGYRTSSDYGVPIIY